MVTWVVFLGVGLVIGVIAGLYFARLDDVTNSQKKALQQKLDEAESQINTYKSQVSEHFLKTATLVNSMTESYKAVHEHLALGARDLCDAKVTVEKLKMPDENLIDVSTDVSTRGAKAQAAAEVESQAEQLQSTAPPMENDPGTAAGHTGSEQSVTEQLATEQSATEQKPQPSQVQAEQNATVEADAAHQAEVAEEKASMEESVAEEPIEPPSTPESLHVDEEASTSSSISDVEQSQTNASRMVH